MEIKVPVKKLGMKKLELKPSLKQIAEAYLHKLAKEVDLKERIFKN